MGDNKFEVSYDSSSGILTATYGEILNGESTALVYSECMNVVAEQGVENIKGVIFDFTKVELSQKDNFTTVQSSSHRANKKVDMSNLPIALVAKSRLQLTIVQMSVRVGADRHRKRIVSSRSEAVAFFKEWHKKQNVKVK